MTKEEFIVKLHQLLSAPDDKITSSWIDWTVDIGRKEDIEFYLRDLYAAFRCVHEKYGGELTQLIYTTMPDYVLMYPNEFMPAAEYLHNGYSFDAVGQMIEADKLTEGTAPCAHRNECDEQAAAGGPELLFGG